MSENAVVTIKLSVSRTARLLAELKNAKADADHQAKINSGLMGKDQRQRSVEIADIIKVIEG